MQMQPPPQQMQPPPQQQPQPPWVSQAQRMPMMVGGAPTAAPNASSSQGAAGPWRPAETLSYSQLTALLQQM
eukprot:385569-Prymnesium_polylepis.1